MRLNRKIIVVITRHQIENTNVDESSSTEGVWWEASGPEVASFNPEGKLTGNQAGISKVLARWGHSLHDTVLVVVEMSESGGPAAFFSETWKEVDSGDWMPFGVNPPVTRILDGDPVLQLRGTEKYSDGLLFMDPIPLGQGITIEMEFKMDLNRDVHQNLSMCLKDVDMERIVEGVGTTWGEGEEVCFFYPAREMAKLNPSEVSLQMTPGFEARDEVPASLPSSGWTHVALQIRADGEPSLVINRERVLTSPILLPTVPRGQWTIKLRGDAVGTELFVRNLNIWQEVRY